MELMPFQGELRIYRMNLKKTYNNMKRICVLFAFLLAAFTSFAQDDVVIVKVEGIAYEIDDATKTAIVGLNSDWGPDGEPFGGVSGVVKIPKHISFEGKKYKVTGIKELAFFNCFDLTSVELPSTVTSIPERAFLNCVSLTAIDIPKSVTSIDNEVFQGSGLTSMVLPKSVTSIGDRAFANCEKLAYVFIPKSVTSIGEVAFQNSAISTLMVDDHNPNYCAVDNVLFNKAQTELIYCPTSREGAYDVPGSVRTISHEAFYECEHLTEVIMPNSVKEIGHDAFFGCDRLSAVTLSDSLTSIDFEAFAACSYLQSIKLPATLKTLDSGAFRGCKALTKIELPDGLTELERSLFADCTALTSVVIPGSVTKIENNVFEGDARLTSISIPSSVAHIESSAFKDCTALRKVQIDAPKLLTDRFSSDKSVASIFGSQVEEYAVGNSVEQIAAHAFDGCEKLRAVTLPSGLKSLEECTFNACENLESIAIPASATSIGPSAFAGCKRLASVEFPSALTIIESGAFSQCSNLTAVDLPASLRSIGSSAFFQCSSLASVSLPASLTTIGESAFSNCTALESVNIPQSVARLDAGVFRACRSLKSIELPALLTTIPNDLLNHCTRLTSVKIPDTVTSIGAGAFEECRSLGTVEIPASVTSIGNDAFRGCNSLSALDIPASVTSVGTLALPYHVAKNSRAVINRNFFGLTLGVSTKKEAISTLLDGGVELIYNDKNTLTAQNVKFEGTLFKTMLLKFYNGVFSDVTFTDGDEGLGSVKYNALKKNCNKNYEAYKYYVFEKMGESFNDDVTNLTLTESMMYFADEAIASQRKKDEAARFRAIRPFTDTRISRTVLDCTLGSSTKEEVIAALGARGLSVVEEAYPDSIVFSGVNYEGVDFKAVTTRFFAGKLVAVAFSNAGTKLPFSSFQSLRDTFQSRYGAYDLSIGIKGVNIDVASFHDDVVRLSVTREGLTYQDEELNDLFYEFFMRSLRGRRTFDEDKQKYVDQMLYAIDEISKD